jgi:hypothetical protein
MGGGHDGPQAQGTGNGTTSLFAALEVATDKIIDACFPRQCHHEFLRFLRQVAKTYPGVPFPHRVRQLQHQQAPEAEKRENGTGA